MFLDECLSPKIAPALNAEGAHVAMHPRDYGGLGASDHDVLARCVEQDLVLVTENARDIHPGLVILPCVGRTRSEALLRTAINFLSEHGDPLDVIVNHVLEVSEAAEMMLAMLPPES